MHFEVKKTGFDTYRVRIIPPAVTLKVKEHAGPILLGVTGAIIYRAYKS